MLLSDASWWLNKQDLGWGKTVVCNLFRSLITSPNCIHFWLWPEHNRAIFAPMGTCETQEHCKAKDPRRLVQVLGYL